MKPRHNLTCSALLGLALLGLAGCQDEAPSAAPAANTAGGSAVPDSTPPNPAAVAAPAVTVMDRAKLANPCLLDAKAVGTAFGITIDKTEPETMGDLYGCSYHGPDGTVRLNMMWGEPVYYDMTVETLRKARPGTKRDVAGDADKAWFRSLPPNLPVLHYYRQNVLVEVVPVLTTSMDAKAAEAALLKLPRVP